MRVENKQFWTMLYSTAPSLYIDLVPIHDARIQLEYYSTLRQVLVSCMCASPDCVPYYMGRDPALPISPMSLSSFNFTNTTYQTTPMEVQS